MAIESALLKGISFKMMKNNVAKKRQLTKPINQFSMNFWEFISLKANESKS